MSESNHDKSSPIPSLHPNSKAGIFSKARNVSELVQEAGLWQDYPAAYLQRQGPTLQALLDLSAARFPPQPIEWPPTFHHRPSQAACEELDTQMRWLETHGKTGDVLLFDWQPSIHSSTEQIAFNLLEQLLLPKISRGRDITHVALLLTRPKPQGGQHLFIVDPATRPSIRSSAPDSHFPIDILLNLKHAELNPQTRNGLSIMHAQRRIETYGGDCWLLPLKEALSADNQRRLGAFILSCWQKNSQFDQTQLAAAGFDRLDPYGFAASEDWDEFFCSEFVSACLKVAGVFPENLNTSEVTPPNMEALGQKVFEDTVPLLRFAPP